MKNFKLNIIKLNVITAILTSICISCTPFGNVNPNKLKNPTTSKKLKKTKRSNNFRNLKKTNNHINSENSAENNQNLENESQNSKSSNQNPQEETTISKLENIGKDMEAQEKEEDTQIAKINDTQYDFLETFKLQKDDIFMHNTKMKLKRIIYPSLNYDTEKILALKEILEKLDKTIKNRRIAGKFLETSRDIQLQQEDMHLKKIQNELRTLSKEKAEKLLQHVERDLKIKQNFVKTLNATIEAYNKNSGNIKTDVEALANHIKEKYSHALNLLNQAD
ncbi:complement regulator-acquiring protein (plasmid) [Borrelia maritima]|uniref:Complement regulator-acquiring protein n=1 Tax=Borrelia maritima TaxID=2761123 RepID=A0A5J6WDT7_9SPIR|nr:complement regulator-acquiring protein [Borrelia maritima]QFI15038.1 complement regulator-acquiring protein [Borrelia maritima]